jgi:ABC-type sugar transport system permease subunit
MHILIVILMCVGVVMVLAFALLSVLRDLYEQAALDGDADAKDPASRRTDINSHA